MIKADNIIKLPRGINPNEMIMRKMDKKYSICPFCGENRRVDLLYHKRNGVCKHDYYSWYGKQTNSFLSKLKLWDKNFHWRVDFWKCNTCGAEWKSEPYPTDAIKISKNMNNIYVYEICELGLAKGQINSNDDGD